MTVEIDPAPITAWFALVIAISTTVTLIIAAVVRINRNFERRVSDLIKETTLPIQADTNGGVSLTDLHVKFDSMDRKVDRLERHYDLVIDTEEKARAVWHEQYKQDQSRARREWTAVFIAIRKMIHLPIKEQVEMWDNITNAYIAGTIVEKFPDERKYDGSVQEP